MRKPGGITVFLSLCILCVSALICVMVEGARTAGSRYYFQVAVNASLDTLFSQYHRELWKQYRILGVRCQSEEDVTDRLESYMEPYMRTENWYPMALEKVELQEVQRLTDQNGSFFVQEILEYMKYGIWSQLELNPQQGEMFWKDIKEAAGAGTMTGIYDGQEKEVGKLEDAVEKILACVEKQEAYARNIREALSQDDAGKFYKEAGAFRRETERMPSLISSYEKRAEQLKQAVGKGESRFQDIQKDFRENRKQLFETQMNPYYAYIEEDGTRYQEVLHQQELSLENSRLLDRTEELVKQLEEEAREREDGDLEGDAEEYSLSPAAALWDDFHATGLMLEREKGDREKRGFLEQVRKMVQGGLLQVVLPEGMELSEAVIAGYGLPSADAAEEMTAGMAAAADVPGADARTLAEQMLVHEYCGEYFLHALSQDKKPVQYELEYILQGKRSDKENLEQTVSQLFLIRQGLNLIHILSDAEKRDEARALAAVITGAAGLAPLLEITACFIIVVWAMGEAVMDLRQLLSGGKIPLWKKKEDWSLSLEGLLSMGQEGQYQNSGTLTEETRGLSYASYLKLLLLAEESGQKQMRMLDVIQMNLQRQEPGFSMKQCAYRVDIRTTGCGKHVFFALPIVENMVRGERGYPLEAMAGKAY